MVYADTGEPLEGLSADEAMAVMRRYVPEHAATLEYERELTDSDQWTLQGIIRSNMPMHRIALGDAAGTEYYVSERTGEPVLRTTASGRFWGYLGAVLHWLYFTPLRRHNALWNSFVVWTSLAGTVMCAMGIFIGVWRYSLAGRFRLRRERSHTPYASWMKWHHYAGLLFGLFACTWAFSGAMSLSPFASLRASAPTRAYLEAATGGPIDLAPLTIDRIRAVAATVRGTFAPKELDFFQFMGEPYFIAYAPPGAGETPPWRNSYIAAATAMTTIRVFAVPRLFATTPVNRAEGRDDYGNSVEVLFNKRMNRGWSGQTSFLLTKNHRWLAGVPQSPNDEFFDLDSTWEWNYRISGTVRIPFDMNVSAFYMLLNGVPGQRTYLLAAHNLPWAGPIVR